MSLFSKKKKKKKSQKLPADVQALADRAVAASEEEKEEVRTGTNGGKAKKAEKDADNSADSKARKAFRELTDDEDGERINVSLRTILGGDILGGTWFRKQFWYIVMVVIMCIIYVSNRYYCQQEMIEGTKLSDTLKDRHIKVLTAESKYKEMTRRSKVQEQLKDTTLQPPKGHIYGLPVDEADTTHQTYEVAETE